MTSPAASSPRHRLLFELGRGGMGTVFLAVIVGGPRDGTLTVVKHLRGDLALQPSFLRSFLDEAKLSMRLHHPNVVVTRDVGFDGTHYFLEMDYLEGQTLDAFTRRAAGTDDTRLDVPRPIALFVLCEVLHALEYAHALTDETGAPLDVVHRDVSPHNVVLTYDGGVKLLDFGIAKAADASAGDTTTGVVKGKLAYMSPEQATRGAIDRRADLFAVGVMLWQFLVGRRLWQGSRSRKFSTSSIRRDSVATIPSAGDSSGPRRGVHEGPRARAEGQVRYGRRHAKRARERGARERRNRDRAGVGGASRSAFFARARRYARAHDRANRERGRARRRRTYHPRSGARSRGIATAAPRSRAACRATAT